MVSLTNEEVAITGTLWAYIALFGVMDVLREGVELSTNEAPTHRNTSQGQGVSQGVAGDRSEVNGRIKQARDEFPRGCP